MGKEKAKSTCRLGNRRRIRKGSGRLGWSSEKRLRKEMLRKLMKKRTRMLRK